MKAVRTAWRRSIREVKRAMVPAAFVWRRLLPRTTFIAVTGSFGKTTCTELVAAVLGVRYRVNRTIENRNLWNGIAGTILRTMPWHRYAVVEAATREAGTLARSSALIRPHIAVVLCVGNTHRQTIRTLADTAAEKARLLSHLRPGGLAVLNADDPLVAAMADGRDLRVVRIGTGAGCDLQADRVAPLEPGRFSLRVRAGGEERTIHTRLYGPHWTPPVLAALAVARECGLSLEDAAAALENAPPSRTESNSCATTTIIRWSRLVLRWRSSLHCRRSARYS